MDKFKYLGSVSIQPDYLRTTTPDGTTTELQKFYLICVEQGALFLRVSKMDEVFEFLSLKNWYKETDTQFFMLQLNIEHWIWKDEEEILYIEEGIYPLDFKDEAPKILKNISKNWKF